MPRFMRCWNQLGWLMVVEDEVGVLGEGLGEEKENEMTLLRC